MNVSSANYVSGNGVYGMQQIDDDKKKEMEELRIKYAELEKRCEEQENKIKWLEDEVNRLNADHGEAIQAFDVLGKFLDEDDEKAEIIKKEDEKRQREIKEDEEKNNNILDELEGLLD